MGARTVHGHQQEALMSDDKIPNTWPVRLFDWLEPRRTRFILWVLYRFGNGRFANAICLADDGVEWCLRVLLAHHNARVLADMEWRLGCVLCECTSGMSKPYYTLEAMRDEIRSYINAQCEQAVEDYQEEQADDVLAPDSE
jgi:hypothetical protein